MTRVRDWLFCDLADCVREEDVIGSVYAALGLGRSAHADPARQIAGELGRRGPVLVLLDNAEVAVEPIGLLVRRWLEATSEARFLVTSRQRLGVAGEQVRKVGALPLAAARELLLDRARSGGTELSGHEEGLEDLLTRLDLVPLALELVAARLSILTPNQIVQRLGRGIHTMTGRTRGGPARHSTLHATIAWSWNLLNAEERRSLAAISVAQSAFSMDAAEAMLGEAVGAERLQSLVDQSLVMVEDAPDLPGEMRFRVFQVVREYVHGQPEWLEGMSEREGRWTRHLLAHGEFLASRVEGPDALPAVRTLWVERDNLLAAFHAACRTDPVDTARLLGVLSLVMPLRAPQVRWHQVLDEAESATRLATSTPRSLVSLLRGTARLFGGDAQGAARDLEEASQHAGGVPGLQAMSHVLLAWAAHSLGDSARATALVSAAHPLVMALDPLPQRVRAFTLLGQVCREVGWLDASLAAFAQAEAAVARTRNPHAAAVIHLLVGSIHLVRGELEASQRAALAALPVLVDIGDSLYSALAQVQLGLCLGLMGRMDASIPPLRDATREARRYGWDACEGMAVAQWTRALVGCGRVDEAEVELRAAADSCVTADGRAHMAAGWALVLRRRNRLADAEASLVGRCRQLTVASTGFDAHYDLDLAAVYLLQGRPEDAERALERVLSGGASVLLHTRGLALCMLAVATSRRDPRRAVTLLEEAGSKAATLGPLFHATLTVYEACVARRGPEGDGALQRGRDAAQGTGPDGRPWHTVADQVQVASQLLEGTALTHAYQEGPP
jgi:predicted ATPase